MVDLIAVHANSQEHLTQAYETLLPDPLLVGLLIAKSAIAAERGIRLSVEVTGLEDSVLLGSRELITVVGNLVDNAFDSVAGPRNGDASVELHMTRYADSLELTVSDDGTGLSPTVRTAMFDEGFTTKETDTHAGIGLTLVTEALATLGGSIEIEDKNGTTFAVCIPNAFASERSLTP